MTVGAVCWLGCGGAATKSAETPDTAGPPPVILSGRVEVDPGGIDTEALLGKNAEAAVEEGATPMQVLAAGAASEGDRIGGFVSIAPDTCLLAHAQGTADVEDLDILSFDDNGESLAADQAISPSPAVLICPPHPARVYVAARVAAGQGLIALGVQAVPPQQAAAVGIKLGARLSTDTDAITQETWPGLAERVAERRRELSGRWTEIRRLSVPLSPRSASHVSVPLPASHCLDVLVMPNEEVRALRVTVADDRGTIIARGAERGEDRTALVCSPVDTTITVSVRPQRGHGIAAVVFSRSEPGAELDLAVRPDARRVGPMQPLEQLRKRVSAALPQRAKVVGSGRMEIGNTVIIKHRIAPGCTRFDVLAGAPITSVRAALWAGDVLLSDAENGEQTTLFGCTDQARDVELELEAQGRPGDYLVEARQETAAVPALQDNPLAAGRVLARANSVTPARTSDLTDVRVVDVSASNRASWPLRLARGACADVIAGLGAGVSGIDLHAFDSATNQVVAKGHGSTVVGLHVCAQDTTLNASLRLSVGAGEGKALTAILRQ